MITENQDGVVAENNEEKGEGDGQAENLTISKKDYETLNQTLGSLKREIKDLKKSKEGPPETPQTKPDEFGLLHKSYLRAAGITHPEDIELARDISKKWNMDVDKLVDDDDFKVKLERQQTARSNASATSNIKGGGGTSQAKNTPEYWIAKGVPPSNTDVTDRKLRAKIVRAMMDNAKTGKTFYNE